MGGDLLQFAGAGLLGADSDSLHVRLDLGRGRDNALRSVVADDDIFVDGVAVVVSDRDHCQVAMVGHRLVDVHMDGNLLLLAHLSVSIADGHNLGGRCTLLINHWLVDVVGHRWHGCHRSRLVMMNDGLDMLDRDWLWSVVADNDFFVLGVAVSISHWHNCDVAMLGHRLMDVHMDGDLFFFANLSVSIADSHSLGRWCGFVMHDRLVHVVDHRWHGSHRRRGRRSMNSWHLWGLVLKKVVILRQGPDKLLVLGGCTAQGADFSMTMGVTILVDDKDGGFCNVAIVTGQQNRLGLCVLGSLANVNFFAGTGIFIADNYGIIDDSGGSLGSLLRSSRGIWGVIAHYGDLSCQGIRVLVHHIDEVDGAALIVNRCQMNGDFFAEASVFIAHHDGLNVLSCALAQSFRVAGRDLLGCQELTEALLVADFDEIIRRSVSGWDH